MSTIVYVDGFNLYKRALEVTPYRWIDLAALAERVLDEEVALVRYFTARVSPLPTNPDAPRRQQMLLRAYEAHDRIQVHFGQFRKRTKKGLLLTPVPERRTIATIETWEEKGSDVNLATHALMDAVEGRAQKVVLLTNDSDLAEPARMLKERGVTVGVIIPKKGLKPKTVPATFYKTLRPSDLAASPLPNPFPDKEGRMIHRPAEWIA